MNIKDNSLDKFMQDNGIWRLANADDCLFHYTGMEAALKIKQEGIFGFNSKLMRDKNEFELGRAFMMLHPCSMPEGVSWEELCADVDDNVRCWTFSLCRNDESPEMVKSYSCGKPGGPVKLVFNSDSLYDAVNKRMYEDLERLNEVDNCRRCYHFLLPCLYAGRDCKKILLLKDYLFGDYLNRLIGLIPTLSTTEIAKACSYIFRTIVKAERYAHEQEFRLVKITFDGSDAKCTPFAPNSHLTFDITPVRCPLCHKAETPS